MRIENMSNGVRVRIGSADRHPQHRPPRIRHHAIAPRGRSASSHDYDELYWNATGNGWTFTDRSGRGAHHACRRRCRSGRARFYTGPQGAQRPRRQRSSSSSPAASCSAPRGRCRRSNGLTVAAAWQKGVVTPPSGAQQARWWLADNLAVPVAVIGPRAGARLLLLRVAARRPRSAARHDHPAVRSADRHVGRRDALCEQSSASTSAASRPRWSICGVNGHLKITGGGSDKPVLEHRGGGKPVPAGRGRQWSTSCSRRKSSLALDQVNHETLQQRAASALSDGLKQAYLGRLFTNNFGWAGFGLVAVVVSLIGLVVLSLAFSHSCATQTGGLISGRRRCRCCSSLAAPA